MAKKNTAEKQKQQQAGKEHKPKQRRSAEDILEERGKQTGGVRKFTLFDCMRFGKIANILFVVFIVVCLIYYYSLAKNGNYLVPFEFTAYAIETTAFLLFTIGIIWMATLVRARKGMKTLMILYILTEVVLMLLEFDLLPFIPYNGLSLPLIIIHSLFSAVASFSMLVLDPLNKRLQWVVGITTTIVLAGMLTGIAGYRVYASILINAFAYIFFFTAAEHLLRLEEMDVDCYGDPTKVTSFDSTMFANAPTMVEKQPKPKRTLAEKAKRLAQDLSSEEKLVLTDKDEKFEYEFGVDDDDDEEYEDDETKQESGSTDGEDDEEA